MDVKEFLKTIPEFAQLSDADIDLVAKLAKVGEVKAGGMVDVQGEPATKFYILVSGRLGVVLELDFGVTKKNYMVTSVGPGQMFAYHLALARGLDIEHPRNIAKVTLTR